MSERGGEGERGIEGRNKAMERGGEGGIVRGERG